MFRVYDGMATLDDDDFAANTRTLVSVNRAPSCSRRRTRWCRRSCRTAGFTLEEYNDFLKLVGAQDHAYAEVAQNLAEPFPKAAEEISAST